MDEAAARLEYEELIRHEKYVVITRAADGEILWADGPIDTLDMAKMVKAETLKTFPDDEFMKTIIVAMYPPNTPASQRN